MTPDTPTKTTDEPAVYIDEVVLFDPREDEAAAALRAELEAERDRRLRLAAEYENYRRRTKQESAQAAEAGKRALLEQIIALGDDLDLALANADRSPDAVADGLRLIHKRFHALLEAHNVAAFESEGEKFDPARHEAFDVAVNTGNAPETVHTEIRRGYFWNDKLLRPALVVVAQ